MTVLANALFMSYSSGIAMPTTIIVICFRDYRERISGGRAEWRFRTVHGGPEIAGQTSSSRETGGRRLAGPLTARDAATLSGRPITVNG
ncbi:hypothetical protein [Amycolatopsis solani]|uniref:hypothetical protein n=1 Tax=Amycolatopsis solani TaxID=3028615 RepID=UPI0025AF42CF|nr:hypothetical protein [Amycolatopsis sp. MEP2-6]